MRSIGADTTTSMPLTLLNTIFRELVVLFRE
jgi:hypothetical protein